MRLIKHKILYLVIFLFGVGVFFFFSPLANAQYVDPNAPPPPDVGTALLINPTTGETMQMPAWGNVLLQGGSSPVGIPGLAGQPPQNIMYPDGTLSGWQICVEPCNTGPATQQSSNGAPPPPPPPGDGGDGTTDGGDGTIDGGGCNPNVCVTACGGASCGNMGTCTNECGGQNSCWMGACNLSAPTCTCGAFNSTDATTPVTFTWTNGGTGLQVWDTEGNWWYNNTASSGIIISSKDNLGVIPGIPPNRTVIARNILGANSSQQCSIQCPMPTPYPTAVITGALRQKSGNACYQANGGNAFSEPSFIALALPGECITPICSPLPNTANATGYKCTVNFDNVGCVSQGKQPAATTSISVGAASQGYGAGQFSDASCNLSGNLVSVSTGTGTIGKDFAFPFTSTKWIKLKNTSFVNKTISSISIPFLTTAYDGTDDTGEKLFIIGEGGSALGVSVNPDPPGTRYSSSNWKATLYPISTIMTPSTYLSYVQSRKQTTTINSLSDIVADGIYIWGSSDNPPSITTVSYNFVLVAAGKTVTIDGASFNTTNTKAVAIIADTINFTADVREANGIFIANTASTGETTDQGLKINGNLVVQTTFNNQRAWSDTSKPSMFVVFKPDYYLTLLPYLSVSKYNWKQTQ